MTDKYDAMREIRDIKTLYRGGKITIETARTMAEKPLDEANKKIVEVSKRFGRKPKLLTFEEAMRIRRFYV